MNCVDHFFASYFGVVLAFEPARSVTGHWRGHCGLGIGIYKAYFSHSSSGHALVIAKLDPLQRI